MGTTSSPGAVPAAPESDMTPVTDASLARELAAPCKADDEDAGVDLSVLPSVLLCLKCCMYHELGKLALLESPSLMSYH